MAVKIRKDGQWVTISGDAATGAPGPAASLNAGTTSTASAGTPASVTNTGTTSAAVFAFEIPQGPAGPPGPPGAGGGGALPFNRFVYTGSLTGYTPTANTSYIRVQLIGGGGGSGAFSTRNNENNPSINNQNHSSRGGGGGAYSELWVRASDIVSGGIAAGSGGGAGSYGTGNAHDGNDGGWSEFYTNFPSGGILLRAMGGEGVAGYNSGSSKDGSGGTTSGAFSVLSGSYSYMSSPILMAGQNGSAQTDNAGDHVMNQTYYTSVHEGLAGDGNFVYGKGAKGYWVTLTTNSSALNGQSGNGGVVIITEFGDF